MARLSKVLLIDADQRARSTLAFGFEREGVKVVETEAEDLDVALIGGDVDAVRRIRAASPRLPILFLGKEAHRADALAAGAGDFLLKPTFVRDVVTLARLHTSGRDGDSWNGDLGELTSLYYLIRACSAANKTGILTLNR